MARGATEAAWLIPRLPGRRHDAVAWMAVAISLALHAAVASRFPDVRLGRLPPAAIEEPLPPIVLGKVVRAPAPLPERPAQYRPDGPGREGPLDGRSEGLRPRVDPAWLAAPDPGPLPGAREALAGLPAPDRPPWEARVARLEITDRVVRDEVAARPRRLGDAVPRAPRAPDVTFPAESWSAVPPGLDALAGLVLGPGFGEGADGRGGSGTDGGGGSSLASRLIEERPADPPAPSPLQAALELEVRRHAAPEDPASLYYTIRIRRRSEVALPVLPKDVLLVQDCSESMTPARLEECKTALRTCLATLRPEDRFDVLAFRDTQERCFGEWVPADAVRRARASWFVERLVSRGRTDVFGGLARILEAPAPAGRPLLAVVLSDGRPTLGVQDDAEILQEFADRNGGRVSVFTLAGGPRVNRFLLDFLAYKNRGDTVVVDDRFEIPGAAERLGRELSRPVLTDVRYRLAGLPHEEAFPRTLTHLYLDRPLVIHGRCPANAARGALRLDGRAGARVHDLVFEVDVANAPAGEPVLRAQWAWQKAYQLMGDHLRTRAPAVLADLRLLEARYGISVPYASAGDRR